MAVLVDRQHGKLAGGEGARIDVGAIKSQVRLRHGRVPVDDELLETFLSQQEVVANPQEIVNRLLGETDIRPHAGMDEEVVA